MFSNTNENIRMVLKHNENICNVFSRYFFFFRNDKLMLKIAKKRSAIVSRLMQMGPCYVSKNTIDGKTDCDRIFPPEYNVPEEEEQENDSCENGSKKKKKKRRKKRDKAEGEVESQSQTADQMSAQDSEDTLDGKLKTFQKPLSLIMS